MFKGGQFALRLRETLQKRHMTQAELASRVGVSIRSMNKYCTAGCVPPVDTFAEIAHELGVSADYLLYGGQRGLESRRDDIQEISVLAGNLEHQERDTLARLTFTLVNGDEEVRSLVADFSKGIHRLTAKINLKQLRVWEEEFKNFRSKAKEREQDHEPEK
ncbi:MAG: helix-turn-helix transcriptional regulator [Nitrospiraceae bacterium]